jgi:GntR family transcriptional regulator / MocR family aminotransferase
MDLHLTLDRSVPLRSQLECELREAIRAGRLRGGAKLPPSRLLAEELAVSRGVVVDAYSQLAAEGYLIARAGHGTRIAEGLARQPPEAPAPSGSPRIRYDLRPGIPDLSLFPRREWQAATSAAVRELPDAALGDGPAAGLRHLRCALSEYLGRVRAAAADPERVFIASGAAHAMSILWHAVRERGARRVAVEDPEWPAIRATVEQAGLEVAPIRVDEHGLEVTRLEAAAVDAVVVSPTHQYITGVALAPTRRARLIAWARRHGTLIVEYDADAGYRYDRHATASLQGQAPECVAYIGSADTTLAPAMRLAWLVAPDHLVGEVAAQIEIAFAVPSALTQATYARLLDRGEIDRHLRRARRQYQARRRALIAALAQRLPDAAIDGATAGLHLIAWMPEDAEEAQISDAAARRAVAIHTLHHDAIVTSPRPPALLLGYGLIAEPAIARAVELLADSVRSVSGPRPITGTDTRWPVTAQPRVSLPALGSTCR